MEAVPADKRRKVAETHEELITLHSTIPTTKPAVAEGVFQDTVIPRLFEPVGLTTTLPEVPRGAVWVQEADKSTTSLPEEHRVAYIAPHFAASITTQSPAPPATPSSPTAKVKDPNSPGATAPLSDWSERWAAAEAEKNSDNALLAGVWQDILLEEIEESMMGEHSGSGGMAPVVDILALDEDRLVEGYMRYMEQWKKEKEGEEMGGENAEKTRGEEAAKE